MRRGEQAFDSLVLGDCVAENAALTSSSALFRRLAPEQGTGPDGTRLHVPAAQQAS